MLLVLECFALITQFFISLHSGIASAGEVVIRYFSYFTLDSNIAVLLCCIFLLINPDHFFARQKTVSAVAVYIFIVSLIYNTILRFIWNPQGLQMIVDELLHLINPLLFIIYWLMYNNTIRLKINAIGQWLIYPLVYIFFVLIRGGLSGFYPYPFLTVNKLGMKTVLINCAGITLLFLVVSLIVIAIGNVIAKKTEKQNLYKKNKAI